MDLPGNPAPVDFALNGVTCTGSADPTASPTGSAQRARRPAVPPTGDHGGRVREVTGGVQFTWPGTYFEGRFRGTGVGLVLNDSNNDYVVQVDGADAATS